MNKSSQPLPTVDIITAKLQELRSQLNPVASESLALQDSVGRILAQDIVAFRDSPAIDVSAMDGYAIRIGDWREQAMPVGGIATAGSPPVSLAPQQAVRIFTGAPVPVEADCVVRREDCHESDSEVRILMAASSLKQGQNIRRKGENAKAGSKVISAGTALTPSAFAVATTFLNTTALAIHRRVRIAILNTGDELVEAGQPIEAWQIRDSNGPFLETYLQSFAWADVHRSKVTDTFESVEQTIRNQLAHCDVLLLTGGVSMGDTDYVPDAIRHCGGTIVFHRIPIRPGKPMLGAIGPAGQLILGLPGNPLSVAVTFRRYALELIQCVAGQTTPALPAPLPILNDDGKRLDLTWFRLAKREANGVRLIASQGSGDIASLAQADGFVEILPNQPTEGLRDFYPW